MPRQKYQPPPGYKNGDQAAAKFNVHPRTWWKWRAQRIAPPGTWIGGRLLWRDEVLDQWLLKREEAEVA
jgi:hypothetical protein